MDKHIKEKGSYTVEASVLFPIIVLTLLILIFTFAYMQQKACIESAAAYASQQGAELWLDSRKHPDNGRINTDLEGDAIGYRLFDNLLFSERTYEGRIVEGKASYGKRELILVMDTDKSLPGRKARLIGQALCYKLRSMILKPEYTEVKITYSNILLSGRITVEIRQAIKVPLSGIKHFLNGNRTLTLAAQATAVVTEPAEYIRSIDLGMEMAKKLKGRLDIPEIIERIKGRR